MNHLIKPATERGEIIFEISITFVPIAILFVMFLVLGDWWQVLEHEEWLFVSAVLLAQAMGKLFIASDHPQLRNKYLLYTIAFVLVMGILWCSLTVAKEVIPLRGESAARQTHAIANDPALNPSSEMTTNVNARLEQIEQRLQDLETNSPESPIWKSVKNIIAVLVASTVFIWAAQIERTTRKPT